MTPPDDPGGPPAGRSRAIGTVVGLGLTLIALAVALAFGLARADDPGQIVREVVVLHDLGAAGPTPPSAPPAPGAPDGFPRFATRAGWAPSGGREDAVEGRVATTAFWDRAGRRVAYTVVSGDPVDAPDDARRTGRRGVLLRSFEAAGRTAVTWTENGHTAVISAIGIPRAALYDLAGGPAPAPRG